MPVRVNKTSVTVTRSGDRVTVPGGQPFNYTDDEIAQIEAANGPESFDTASVAVAAAVSSASQSDADDEKPAPRRKPRAKDNEDDL